MRTSPRPQAGPPHPARATTAPRWALGAPRWAVSSRPTPRRPVPAEAAGASAHRLRPALLGLAVLLCAACDDATGADQRAALDGGADAAWDQAFDDGDPRDGPALDASVEPDATAAPACRDDQDCADLDGARGYCESAACVLAPAAPFVRVYADGVTRAGAARMDITPEYLEPWTDRAGAECPANRRGQFDGLPAADDPCADRFDDADGDGEFDAIWLGGGASERPASGVDNENPPSGRVLVLARDDVIRVVISYDLYAIDAARLVELQARLALRLGVTPSAITVHVTGSRHSPDAVGLWGPGPGVGAGPQAFFARAGAALGLLASVPYASGVDPTWWRQLLDRTTVAARRAGAAVVPVSVRHAITTLPVELPVMAGAIEVPDADGDGRRNDPQDLAAYRDRAALFSTSEALIGPRDRRVRAISLTSSSDGAPVATLVGWGAAPALEGATPGRLSAGFPGLVRQLIEAERPGDVAIWLSSAGADTVVVDDRVFLPEVSAAGQLLDEDGRVVERPEAAAPAVEPAAALGRYLARAALRGLDEAAPARAELSVRSRFAWVPLRNPRFGLAARLGVLGALGDWLSGRTTTAAWSSGSTTPACGGLGCLRYRLDRISLGEITIVTTPGGLADAFLRGQEDASITYADRRELLDLDADGVPDADDPEIRVMVRGAGRETVVSLPRALNPQRFDAVYGISSPQVWVVGRTNGGVGTLGSAWSTPNVFEGALGPLTSFVSNPDNASINLCAAGYPCRGELRLGDLASRTTDAQPAVLADLTGAHELSLDGLDLGTATEHLGPWRIEDPQGEVRIAGEGLVLGPGNRVYAPADNLVAAGVVAGDTLHVEGDEPQAWRVRGVTDVVLATHPGATDAWRSATPDAGEIVYNVACELIFDEVCPHRRALPWPDPNQALPRAP